ncbi:mucin-5AC-like [Vombatus ursinus]|uniref:mucin-5AC-like n=1 Tax=Vombatus ursinus TaxID=29139 RepID=UPI000FFD9B97|nr:mucin-5AC-like [Vombatus ursinus]
MRQTAYKLSHNGRVCSTWGSFHYKTFDGDVFHFPGLCNYVFSSHCKSAYEDFNIQMRRSPGPNATTTVSHITLKLEGTIVEMSPDAILVNGKLVQLPFSQSGILIEKSSAYVKVMAKLGLEFMWNQDDGLLLELDAKYANQTCGLCGDFNGIPTYSEFFSNNIRLTAVQFGNMQKMDGPTEQCQDPLPTALHNCTAAFDICETTLNSTPFFTCRTLVDVSSYVEACRQDACLCDEGQHTSCICSTLTEYSRQCAHAGGQPMNWRAPDLCPKTCHLNMQYHECGSPCVDTCSNPEQSAVCEEHCMDGCFCPPGTVFDDIGSQGCVPVSQCFCVHNGQSYAPGAFRSTECTNCTCSGGQWSCQDLPCPGTCSVTGGSHFSTFDEKHYTVHGDCSYVLVKPCDDKAFTVLAELRKCGLTDSETCLKSVSLSISGGQTVIVVKSTGEVFVNSIYSQLPVSAGNATLFRPSSSFIIAQTTLGLQLTIQLIPIMQVFVRLEPSLRGLTCGLCGNFNSIQADDFKTMSGVVEGTAAAFVNTYKTQANCPNIKNHFEDPCTLSVENEKYAQHWCGLLTDPQGLFAKCHAVVSPALYHSNCMFDTCNCEKSEDCLCAALSSYVQACAARGVLLSGWRVGVCTKTVTSCPKSLTYHYNVTTCQPTCRSLSEPDVTCSIKFGPVDGCTCQEGTFMDDNGKCVPAASCPCYYQGSAVPNGESVHDNGAMCTCTQGRLNCIGGQVPKSACAAPMLYFDCSKASAGVAGAECQKSCHTLDMDCYSSQCVSGCKCPDGLVSDGEGGCIHKDQCPCVHNEARYQAGETIQVECNTCTCENRMWRCTQESCLATCAVYGDGHYITFDGQRYSFNGDCEYTLVQDHCGKSSSAKGTFRVITENIPCGTTGTTCSKTIKIFLGSYELKLSEGRVEVMEKKGAKGEPPYSIRQMGIYLIVDTNLGLVLLWDKKTSIFIQLSPDFKRKVCGLCGNYDGNSMNDFTTRSLSVVGDAQEFGNSWKSSPSCPDTVPTRDPCTANPYRKAWAQKQCSVINSAVFAACHPHVEPTRYYEACVSDACACDTGGDCECFCTAVAAYAQACNEINVCISWRTPSICPLFCDYYNPNGSCEWHYQPCGAPCMKTCHNPSGKCSHNIRGLEGCYPKCPPKTPIFDEDKMECVQSCAPCYIKGRYYPPGSTVPSDKNCQSCSCTEAGIKCTYDSKACICTYKGKLFHPGDIIYHTTDGTGGCITATCSANGTIEGKVYDCVLTTSAPSTTFAFSDTTSAEISPVTSFTVEPFMTSLPMTVPTVTRANTKPFTIPTTDNSVTPRTSFESVSTSSTTSETTCDEEVCTWSPWLDVSHPGTGANSGDFDTLENIRAEGYRVCRSPKEVECRSAEFPAVPWQELNQTVKCSRAQGLICHNKDQVSGKCDNYQIRILCCFSQPCTHHNVTAPTTEPHSGSTVALGTSISRPPTTPEPKGISESHLTKSTPIPSTKETQPITKPAPSPETPGTSSHSPDVTTTLVTKPMESCPSPVPSSSFPSTLPSNTSATTSPPYSTFPPLHVSTTFSTFATQSSSSCYCYLSGKVYRSGTLIYNQTDHAGLCYSAFCNKDCNVTRVAVICPTSSPAPVPSISSSTPASAVTATATATSPSPFTLPSASSSLSPVSPTKSRDCLNAVPPRKKGETWFIHKCKKATCEGDDVITLTPVSCPVVKKMSCANGYPPVKVYDDADHCCYHYECQCVCSGWGDPHYITFDGIYYTFLDNCTYVLVQQIHSVYDHFRVLIDNYFCGAQDGLSCPRSITVEYKGNRIVLIRTVVHGVMENEVIFNNMTVSAGFKKDGIVISTLGIKMFVTIPEIGVQVMFSGLLFSVEVPFTKFGNNTEGQCGTCTNDKKDECRLPDGKIVSSCSEMSGSWKYHVPNQPYCHGPSPTPTPIPTMPSHTTPKSCPPSLLCMLIMSKVFEACHRVIPPEPYFEGCVYDQCHIPEDRVWCSGLELYASLCAAQGVCIDWRRETQGLCSLTCPGNKVYQPCGPIYTPTCQNPQGSINTSLIIADDISLVTEGCFCPNGTTLFSSNSNICVPATPPECHIWCKGPNGQPVEPGAVVSSGPCETCSCVPDGNPESKTYVIKCKAKVCDTHCPAGSKYQERPGRCCGKCVQVACAVHTNDSSVQLVQPGKSWSRPGNKCVQYECEEVNGQLILVTVKKACPPILCSPDQVRRSEDGCCHVCPSPPQVYPCAVGRRTQVIRKGRCSSSAPLEVTYCQGNCGDTMSIYSFEANVVEHRCRCCRELRTSQRNVSLSCPDGSSLAFAFTRVEECGCQGVRCDSLDIKRREEDESAPSREQEPEQSQEQGLPAHQDEQTLHWRRAAPGSLPQR